jgi:hypothetical protein
VLVLWTDADSDAAFQEASQAVASSMSDLHQHWLSIHPAGPLGAMAHSSPDSLAALPPSASASARVASVDGGAGGCTVSGQGIRAQADPVASSSGDEAHVDAGSGRGTAPRRAGDSVLPVGLPSSSDGAGGPSGLAATVAFSSSNNGSEWVPFGFLSKFGAFKFKVLFCRATPPYWHPAETVTSPSRVV